MSKLLKPTVLGGQKGFTIVELLIVIVIIGVLAALVVVGYNGIQGRANDASVQADLRQIKTKIEAYYADYGQYPYVGSANLNIKVNKAAYQVLPQQNNNVIYYFPADYQKYALIAQSKSGTYYHISNTEGVTPGNINTSNPPYSFAGGSNLRGYAGDDSATGPWRAWVGGN